MVASVHRLTDFFHLYQGEIRAGLKEISKGAKTSEETIDKLLKDFLFCLQPAVRTKIKIFSLDSDRDLDDTIFEAIIQGRSLHERWIFPRLMSFPVKQHESAKTKTGLHRQQLLQLALAWDAIEIAKQHIIKDDLDDLSVRRERGAPRSVDGRLCIVGRNEGEAIRRGAHSRSSTVRQRLHQAQLQSAGNVLRETNERTVEIKVGQASETVQ